MSILKSTVGAICLGALMSTAPAQAQSRKETFQLPLPGSHGDGVMHWRGQAGKYLYKWFVVEKDREMALCDVGYGSHIDVRRISKIAARKYSLLVNDKPVYKKGIAFFAKATRAKNLKSGVSANCIKSGAKRPKGNVKFGLGSTSQTIKG